MSTRKKFNYQRAVIFRRKDKAKVYGVFNKEKLSNNFSTALTGLFLRKLYWINKHFT